MPRGTSLRCGLAATSVGPNSRTPRLIIVSEIPFDDLILDDNDNGATLPQILGVPAFGAILDKSTFYRAITDGWLQKRDT